MLSPDQVRQRDGKLTASRVACLMTGDADKINNLWREMTGDPSFVEEDLSGVWPVQLGSCTEVLNIAWFERKHGPVTRQGEVVIGPQDWMACTLDGWSELHSAPVECKHVGGRETLETVIARYQPQMQWQMLCTGATRCAISVIEGSNAPIVEYIDFDPAYATELFTRGKAFMQCVWSMTPPIAQEPVAAPVLAVKTYDMQGNNQWGSEAVTWLTTRGAAKDFAASEKAIKQMIPADAIKCHGHGITVSRNRAGSLSIKELA